MKDIKNKMLDVVFILDKSGSMSGSEESTISSFNEYLEREKNNSFTTRITTLLFSNTWEYLHKRKNIKSVSPLTRNDYTVDGCTALYDALGEGIHFMKNSKTDKVLFIIITDGYENASKEYRKDTIRKLIQKHSNWEFIYIGADIDSYAEASSIGLKKDHIANYKKDKTGSSMLFRAVSHLQENLMCGEALDSSWKNDLDSYCKQ